MSLYVKLLPLDMFHDVYQFDYRRFKVDNYIDHHSILLCEWNYMVAKIC